jgi:Tfp pilus assembly PilM family ATPase
LEITRALERGLNIDKDRAEIIKKDIGLSPRPEEKEIASIISPFVEVLFAEVERMIALYNRRAPRQVQKIILSGGGSGLKGLVDYASIRLGVEVTRGNPFSRVITPAFMQPLLRELGPNFPIAVGLALHEITNR